MNKTIAATAAAGVLAVLLPSQSMAAADAEPTRVLIVGDSMSQGDNGFHSWRYFAWKQLTAGPAAPPVDFVGPWTGTYSDIDTWGGSYADPNFDQDHAARWGQALWQGLESPDERSPAIADLVAAHDPDVIVEALGTNDIAWAQMTPVQMSNQVRTFVARARAVKPDVDVILGGVPQEWIPRAADYNDVLPALAAELSTAESRVVAAEVPVFVEGHDTVGFVHPSQRGEMKLGTSYADAMASLLPTPPPLGEPTESPSPTGAPPVAPVPAPQAPTSSTHVPLPTLDAAGAPRRVKAVSVKRRTVVTWRAGSDVEYYVVRCGRTERTTEGRRLALRVSTARSCKVRSVNAAGLSPWVKVRVEV
ncbi:hypothetical protein GCM10023339_30770 [Alloalcanivorax gelatiniphagus]